MMSRLNVAVDDVANAEAEKKAQYVVFAIITKKFLVILLTKLWLTAQEWGWLAL